MARSVKEIITEGILSVNGRVCIVKNTDDNYPFDEIYISASSVVVFT